MNYFVNSMKQIVIFGGMFDPPHVGHALDVDNVLHAFPCDEIWIVPSGSRSDKVPQIAPGDRWEMARIFCQDYFAEAKAPVIPMQDEMDMPPPTYTWAWYEHLVRTYPDSTFHFLLGSTNIPHIRTSWEHGEELFRTINFLVSPHREDMTGYVMPPHAVMLEGGRITTNLSSTFIRRRLNEGFSPLPYVLPRIADYIKAHNLYRS